MGSCDVTRDPDCGGGIEKPFWISFIGRHFVLIWNLSNSLVRCLFTDMFTVDVLMTARFTCTLGRVTRAPLLRSPTDKACWLSRHSFWSRSWLTPPLTRHRNAEGIAFSIKHPFSISRRRGGGATRRQRRRRKKPWGIYSRGIRHPEAQERCTTPCHVRFDALCLCVHACVL